MGDVERTPEGGAPRQKAAQVAPPPPLIQHAETALAPWTAEHEPTLRHHLVSASVAFPHDRPPGFLSARHLRALR